MPAQRGFRIHSCRDLPQQVDVAIVGAGFSGLQFAAELWAEGVSSVLLIEAGPVGNLVHNNIAHSSTDAEELWLSPSSDIYFWQPWKSLAPPHFTGRVGLRRRMGGRSLYWQGITIPIENWALQEPWWPREVIDWLTVSWRGGQSLYQQIAENIEQWRVVPSKEISLSFFHAIGAKEVCVAPAMVRHHYLDNGIIKVAAYSPTELYLRGADDSSLPLVASGTMATGLILEGNRVKGVRTLKASSGGTGDILCDFVILAAGTIENTRLAVQAMHEIQKESMRCRLVDHLAQGFAVRVTRNKFEECAGCNVQVGPVYLLQRDEWSRSNFFATLYMANDDYIVDVWSIGEQLPSEHNFIRCNDTGGWPWETEVSCSLSEEDKLIISRQQSILLGIWQGIKAVFGIESAELSFADFDKDSDSLYHVSCRVRSGTLTPFEPLCWAGPLGSVDHEGGTLPYGKVLRNDGEFHNIQNLFAIGPCSFPRLGAANPALTNLALIRNVASAVASRL